MNFNGQWTATEAVLNLYFSDDKTTRKGGSRHQQVERAVIHALAAQTYRNDAMTAKERAAISEIARAVPLSLLENAQAMDIPLSPMQRPNAKRHALLWLRWALQNRQPQPLSSHVLYCFSKWRDDHPEPGIWEVRYTRVSRLKSRGKFRRSKAFGKIHGFTLDEFLLAPELSINDVDEAGLHQLRLTVSRTPRLPQATGKDKPKLRKKKYHDHQGMQQDCGTNVLNEVIRCVTECAALSRFHLSSTRKSGRYPCKLSRLELANELRKKYPTLKKYVPDTIARAISAIASCPKGNTKKSRPPVKKIR